MFGTTQNNDAITWSTPPNAEEVLAVYKEKARLGSLLKAAKLEFKIMQAEAKSQSSKTWAAVIGPNPEDHDDFVAMQRQILQHEQDLEIVDTQIALFKHRIEMYKAWSWQNR